MCLVCLEPTRHLFSLCFSSLGPAVRRCASEDERSSQHCSRTHTNITLKHSERHRYTLYSGSITAVREHLLSFLNVRVGQDMKVDRPEQFLYCIQFN